MSSLLPDEAFLDDFFALPNLSWPGRSGSHASAAYLRRFLGALESPGEAPLVLPRKELGWPAVCAYVICHTPSHAARVRGLLAAAVGQNWCEFDGRLAHLRPDDPIDAAVIQRFGANTTYVLRPPTSSAQQAMFAALSQLVTSLEQRPSRETHVAKPVGRLLRDFETSLAAGQAATSLELLEAIERTGGISHENIAFLRIRRLGQLGEDRQILADGALRTVVATEPPRLVREAILAAWYRENARDHSTPAELIQRLREFRADIALLVEDKSFGTLDSDAWNTAALVALARKDASLARGLVGNDAGVTGDVHDLLESLANSGAVAPPARVVEGASLDALTAGLTARATEPDSEGHQVDDGSSGDAEVRESLQTEATDLAVSSSEGPIDSWPAWLESLHIDTAVALDAETAETWPPPGHVDAELAAAIDALPDSATGRLFAGLAAFIDCDDFSRPAWRTAGVLIRRHLLSDSLTPSDLGAIAALLAIFLRGAPDVGKYRELLDDLADEDFRGRWAAVGTASAALDIADLIVTSPTADRAAQQGFVATTLQGLHAQRHRLHETLRVIGGLATEDAGLTWDWNLDGQTEVPTDAGTGPRAPVSILLYSLEEAVLARARTAVERLYPDVQVTVSSAKVGSTSLREQARRAELIVLATRRATHAATGFIQSNAGNARVHFADGCGSASLLRAIEQGIRLSAG